MKMIRRRRSRCIKVQLRKRKERKRKECKEYCISRSVSIRSIIKSKRVRE